jgi:hypothetical protein
MRERPAAFGEPNTTTRVAQATPFFGPKGLTPLSPSPSESRHTFHSPFDYRCLNLFHDDQPAGRIAGDTTGEDTKGEMNDDETHDRDP